MRYSAEPRYRKHVREYDFCNLLENLVINMEKKRMDIATKTGIDAPKTASKRVVQKSAQATADLIENKIADKINSLVKPKEKNKECRRNLYSAEKRQQIIDDLKLF